MVIGLQIRKIPAYVIGQTHEGAWTGAVTRAPAVMTPVGIPETLVAECDNHMGATHAMTCQVHNHKGNCEDRIPAPHRTYAAVAEGAVSPEAGWTPSTTPHPPPPNVIATSLVICKKVLNNIHQLVVLKIG